MSRIRMAIGLVVATGALLGGTAPAQADPICTNNAVHRGCTSVTVDENGVCIGGGGTIANRIRYMWAPC